jgi:hypothetical protein
VSEEILTGAKHINANRYELMDHAAIQFPGQAPGPRNRARALCGEDVWVFPSAEPFDPSGSRKCPKCVVKFMAQER